MTKPEQAGLREKLAAIEHERWADWQKWCHKIIRQTIANGGSIEEVLARWDKQIETPYAALSESEQASDMEQVDRYWPLILDFVESTCLEVIGKDEARYDAEGYPNEDWKQRNDLRAQQRQALSKLLGRGEDG